MRKAHRKHQDKSEDDVQFLFFITYERLITKVLLTRINSNLAWFLGSRRIQNSESRP